MVKYSFHSWNYNLYVYELWTSSYKVKPLEKSHAVYYWLKSDERTVNATVCLFHHNSKCICIQFIITYCADKVVMTIIWFDLPFESVAHANATLSHTSTWACLSPS